MADPLWGGRFAAPPHPGMLRLTRSVDVDMRLLPQDLTATKAHARALAAAGLLEADALPAIDAACDAIAAEWAEGSLPLSPADEDVHSVVERTLTERLGDTGARIHAGRSRNDLVAEDLRLWCDDAAAALARRVGTLIEALTDRAEEHLDTVMPGYTHLQRAQPVSVGFWLAAHATALGRDLGRLAAGRRAAQTCVLGAGALAGTTLPLDPAIAARELGARELFSNAMDAVADRDFACDLVYACALCGVHLSRLAEDVVVFSSAEFGFLVLPDAWSTGSSIMPQKRNPDIAELVRGRAAGGIGDLVTLLTLLKGLPLAYDRDLQEDKERVFAAVDRLDGCLEAMTGLVGALGVDAAATERAAGAGATWATDAAERLVLEGVPFRHAHERVGRAVAEGDGAEPSHDPRASVAARRSRGGTAPERVVEQIAALRTLAREHV
ncbi:MAG TPA: argininosuccinate lyase [Actinomycetota bacterium]|nr:argininosuccinate lyase [Actinomycetota bacterium]